MRFTNETAFPAGWTIGFQPDGRELLIVVVKGSFTLPAGKGECSPARGQIPLTQVDQFVGEPGLSATLYEADYAHIKPYCDVLLNGSAYAPGGQSTSHVDVSLSVGSLRKSFRVVGDRVWCASTISPCADRARPFTQLPISYSRAFGGRDIDPGGGEKIQTYCANPVGIGYYPLTKSWALDGKPLPNTEQHNIPVTDWKATYEPMSFGAIGRNFERRVAFAGTYDERWLQTRAPFFPQDFDYRYFQSAPIDQQIVYPLGGELVVLENLTPDGYTHFRLPDLAMPVLFIPYRGEARAQQAVVDTLLIEPDLNRFTITWRVSVALRKDCFELREVIAGIDASVHVRRRSRLHKPRYGNLLQFMMAKRGRQ